VPERDVDIMRKLEKIGKILASIVIAEQEKISYE
jgi:hypothetical protein